jgi:hypothetical protein
VAGKWLRHSGPESANILEPGNSRMLKVA